MTAGTSKAQADVLYVKSELDAVYSFIWNRVGRDRALAEDLAQDTILTALQGTYVPSRGPLKAWLLGIALRKIIEHHRRRISQERLAAVARELAVRLVREPLPEEWLGREEVRALVGEALALLPGPVATLLTRKYFDGASVAELATELGTTEKAVESQLTRARIAFHEVIERLGAPSVEYSP